jgi:SH3 domain protein
VIWAAIALLAALFAAPAPASADFVRDELRINMRAGPGLQYRIVKVLSSGEEVARVGARDDWVEVRAGDGSQGWVPAGYLSKEAPPSVTLPKVESRLERAQARVRELEEKLASQQEALTELHAAKSRAEELEVKNIRLSGSTRWKELAAGGGIVLVGMLLGSFLAKANKPRSRRVKL